MGYFVSKVHTRILPEISLNVSRCRADFLLDDVMDKYPHAVSYCGLLSTAKSSSNS